VVGVVVVVVVVVWWWVKQTGQGIGRWSGVSTAGCRPRPGGVDCPRVGRLEGCLSTEPLTLTPPVRYWYPGSAPTFDGRIVRVTSPPYPCDATPRTWDIHAVAVMEDTVRDTCVFG